MELTAENAHATARKALAMFSRHEEQIRKNEGPSKLSVLAVYHQLRQRPISDAKSLTAGAGVTPPTTRRVFAYKPLIELLQEDLPL